MLLTDTVAVNGSLVPGSATATSGTPSITGNTLTWNGTVAPNGLVTITFRVQLTPTVSAVVLTNTFNLSYNGTVVASNIVTTTIEPHRAYLPIVLRQTTYYAFVPIVFR